MKYIKRMYYTMFAIPVTCLLIIGMLLKDTWNGSVDNLSYKFWE
jgi:hypothetical protein